MKTLYLISLLLLFSTNFVCQVDWSDYINRNENLRLNQKKCIYNGSIELFKMYLCSVEEQCPNESPFEIYKYDIKGNLLADYHSIDLNFPQNIRTYDTLNNSYHVQMNLKDKNLIGTDNTYFFNSNGKCVKHISSAGVDSTIHIAEYNEKGHVDSYSRIENGELTDQVIVDLAYDNEGRLIHSKECHSSSKYGNYCSQNKDYEYIGDSVIVTHYFGEWNEDYKRVYLQTIVAIDSNGNIRLYVRNEYNPNTYPLKKKKKVLHRDKWAYDKYGNNTEFEFYDSRNKRGNTHLFYNHTLDSNGNILRTETANAKGKIDQVSVYEYKKY